MYLIIILVAVLIVIAAYHQIKLINFIVWKVLNRA